MLDLHKKANLQIDKYNCVDPLRFFEVNTDLTNAEHKPVSVWACQKLDQSLYDFEIQSGWF